MTDPRDYYQRAQGWADDNRVATARSRRTAGTIAGIAVAIALFEAVALAMLAPLKTVQPITLLVDRQTGYVQALDPYTPKRVSADEALTNALLAQYIMAREQFDRATVAADYRRVALWSTGQPRQAYLTTMPATNPASPFQRYPAGTMVRVRVKSISRLSQGVALVRFDTQVEDRTGRVDVAQPWLSVVRFRYVDAPMQFEDRLSNPLGFQVVGYRRDAEAAPPPAAAQSAIGAATAAAPSAVVTTTTVVREPNAARSPQSGATVIIAPPVMRTRPATPRIEPRTGAVYRREVPINQIPMGSPLSPARLPKGFAAAAAPR